MVILNLYHWLDLRYQGFTATLWFLYCIHCPSAWISLKMRFFTHIIYISISFVGFFHISSKFGPLKHNWKLEMIQYKPRSQQNMWLYKTIEMEMVRFDGLRGFPGVWVQMDKRVGMRCFLMVR